MRNSKRWAILSLLMFIAAPGSPAAAQTLLLQSPTLSKSSIAFAYGGRIWITDREGGEARPIVSGLGRASSPRFSPDGSQIAFSADYNGNVDVYAVPSAGGEPRRLTWHPGPDVVSGWTPDGKSVLFTSHRYSYADPNQLFTVPAEGGFPSRLPLVMAQEGSYSPDGTRLAYVPNFQWQPDWKKYRGGQTTPVWIADLSDSSIVKVPRSDSNDRNPMWVGEKIYFLSDRNGPVTLFEYELKSRKVNQVLPNDGFDIKSACAGPGGIVYEQFGTLHLYDTQAARQHVVSVTVRGDMPQLLPHFEKVAKQIQNAAISPTGVRGVFEAHGEILSVPVEKGDIRNLTKSPAVEDRSPAWAPDGKSIAYFSDESGEYALHIRDQSGLGDTVKIDLGRPPSFFYGPKWSPDSRKIAYSDKRLNLWYVDLDRPTPVKVDTDRFDSPLHEFDVVWSPDSRWLAYTKQLENHLRAVFVYSLDSVKAVMITDGMSDALYPNFDKNGKYLYFTASTDMGLTAGWLDMTSEAHPVTRSVYVTVLRKDLPSPVAPESDEEKPEGAAEAAKGSTQAEEKASGREPARVVFDFENIGQRILALPIPARNYVDLIAGKEGVLYLLQAPQVVTADNARTETSLHKFDLKTRKTEKLLDGVTAFSISFDGGKMLYRTGENWLINPADKPPEPGKGMLNLESMEVHVDPRAEWEQMYREVWRIERDFLYDPNYHGLNLKTAEATFRPFLENITTRDDLDYLFREMLSYISVGHMFVSGPPGGPPQVNVGLLGADYEIENGRFRFARIFNGENWNPQLHAPLTQPGINVQAGEYLLAVNGRELSGADNIYSFFLETAGKQTVLRVGPNPDGSGARDVTVVPVPNEGGLRNLAWVEGNRRKVEELSAGRLAYVHLPDTAGGGFTSFNRYYFAQVGKEGAVIDERFNHGGQLADYIIDFLRRPVMSFVMTRQGETYPEPAASIYGPKAMIINQFAGSGGDALPWYFRRTGIGPLVGMRTWGGLVGIGNYPTLMDGGMVTAPRWAIYGTEGEWEVENHGIPPDIEVEQDPKLVRDGHDPQLEKAVEVVLEMLKKNPPKKYAVPAYPDFKPSLPPPPK